MFVGGTVGSRLATVGIFALFGAQALAETASESALKACAEPSMLAACPNTCASACTSVGFLRAHTDGCLSALTAGPGSDGADCGAIPSFETAGLASCIAGGRAIEREPGILITRSPARLEIFESFFSDRPACAASALGLREMFSCLDGEADIVNAEYGSLGSLGIPDGPLDPQALEELACGTSEERLVQIDIGAQGLKGRADILQDRLGEVATCRREYAAWFDSRGSFCQQNPFPNCESTISIFQSQLEAALAGASEQNRKIADVVENLTRDIESLMSIGIVRTGCP